MCKHKQKINYLDESKGRNSHPNTIITTYASKHMHIFPLFYLHVVLGLFQVLTNFDQTYKRNNNIYNTKFV